MKRGLPASCARFNLVILHAAEGGPMTLIERAQAMVLRPKETWPTIEAEPATVGSLYRDWLVYMAAIPAVCAFIGLSIVGGGVLGMSFHLPIVTGLANMITSYLMSLVLVYVVALLIDALAPTFGGTKNPIAALKVAAYGSTAAYLGGVFSLLPALGVLGLVAAIYSIYLVYLGLPVLMKCPAERAGGYTAALVVCTLVAGLLLGAIRGALHLGVRPW
jgi:hypothetical protein